MRIVHRYHFGSTTLTDQVDTKQAKSSWASLAGLFRIMLEHEKVKDGEIHHL